MGTALLMTSTWRDAAACRNSTIDFVPTLSDEVPRHVIARLNLAAKAICATCEVREPCLQWAIEHEEHGIWGGTTATERAAMSGRANRQPDHIGPGTKSGPRTAEAVAIYAVLEDGDWHDREDLVDAVLAVLTDERARQIASTGGRGPVGVVTYRTKLAAARVSVSNVLSPLVRARRVARQGEHFRLVANPTS